MGYNKIPKWDLSPTPKPFPGKHPTRILIQSKAPDFRYEGKPVSSLLQLVREHYILKRGRVDHLVITEYDQNGSIRQTRGGAAFSASSFANIYFPMPAFYREFFGRAGHVYAMLDRELVDIQGRKVYRNKWWDKSVHSARFRQMMKDCAKDRVNLGWFDFETADECVRELSPLIEAWTHVPAETAPARPISTDAQQVLNRLRRAQQTRRATPRPSQPTPVAPVDLGNWVAQQIGQPTTVAEPTVVVEPAPPARQEYAQQARAYYTFNRVPWTPNL